MNKIDLKKILKPIIKECIKEAILEEGVLSGLITEIATGLGNIQVLNNQHSQPIRSSPSPTQNAAPQSTSIMEAKLQLNEVKNNLSKATGFKGVFEGTKPLQSSNSTQSGKYGALRDKDPGDSGVNIDGLIKMTGGWSHLA
tara:strand:- start:1194 stop:1616 length:423 start_codon:yes stop_codon:yes gene_type:complete